MEISQQTADELKAKKQKEYEEWNNKINGYAEEVINLLSEKQVSLGDSTEIIKLVNTIISAKAGMLNINNILNNKK